MTISLRSVELEVEDVVTATDFLVRVWGMAEAQGAAANSPVYLRGAGAQPYLVALHPAAASSVRTVTFNATPAEIEWVAERARAHGAPVEEVRSEDLGGGAGVVVRGPEGEAFRFLGGDTPAGLLEGRDLPVKLTHVVVNSTDAEKTAAFAEAALGFRVSDRTKGMVFVRCNQSHHSIAFARAGFPSLNHIAFEMEDIDAVMRGIGRLRDSGLAPSWGPGRHGPGANVFAYFVAPFGPVVEFSTAVETVGDDYRVGAPDDWTWPEGRIDQWGLGGKDLDALGAAERRFRFKAASEFSDPRRPSI